MPLIPKPPKRRQCRCQTCVAIGNPDVRRERFVEIISGSYTREELRTLVQVARATMLPREPW